MEEVSMIWRNLTFWVEELLRVDSSEGIGGVCRVCHQRTRNGDAHLKACAWARLPEVVRLTRAEIDAAGR